MTVVGDFQIVTTGGEFSSSESFVQPFPTRGRAKGGYLGYFLMEWRNFPEDWAKPATMKFYVNGHHMATLPIAKAHLVSTIRFYEDFLFATKDNTFKVLPFNAWGSFVNVICHYHQAV